MPTCRQDTRPRLERVGTACMGCIGLIFFIIGFVYLFLIIAYWVAYWVLALVQYLYEKLLFSIFVEPLIVMHAWYYS